MTCAQLCNSGNGIAILPTYFELIFPNLQRIYTPKVFSENDLWILTHKDLQKDLKAHLT